MALLPADDPDRVRFNVECENSVKPYAEKKPAPVEPVSDYEGPDVSNEGPARFDIDDDSFPSF